MWLAAREWQRAQWSVANGQVTFAVPPAAGEPVVLTTKVFWRARFADDYLSTDHLAREFHEAQQVRLVATMGPFL